jgi:glycosyltransferase involved in cell wall biosynthesis
MSAGGTPFVSIVVPVLNGEGTIGDCLASLLQVDFPDERREIIVVDNGSRDRTVAIAAAFPVRVVREPRRSRSCARNRGIAEARGELVAFTDADCAVSTNWLAELASGFEREEVGAVAGEVVAYPAETPVERYLAARRPAFNAWSLSQKHRWIAFPSAAVRRLVFDRIGAFDPRIPGGADIDFSWRMLAAGFEIGSRPKALVFHRHPSTIGMLVRQRFRYGRGHAALCSKYPETIPWGWREEEAAWRDLAASAVKVAAGGARVLRGRGGSRRALESAYIDLARKAGERAGFVEGTVRGGAAAVVEPEVRELGSRLGLRLDAGLRRRRRLHATFIERFGLEVRSGPFSGLVYPSRAEGWVYNLVPRLLGTYELELHKVFEDAIAHGYQTYVDVGSGDGYYAVGLALKSPSSTVRAFERSPGLRRFAAELAALNGVADRLEVHGACDADRLARLPSSGRTFVKVDCEGCEAELLSTDTVPLLRTAEIVVELHDGARAPPEWLRRRFAASHDLRLIAARPREAAAYEQLARFEPAEALQLISEGRATRMRWAHLKPRS